MNRDAPRRYDLYFDSEPVTHDREVTEQELLIIHIRANRVKQAGTICWLILVPLVLNLAQTQGVWTPFVILILSLLGLLTTWPLHHALLLGRVRPGDRVVDFGSQVIDSRGLVLFDRAHVTWRPVFHRALRRVALVPPEARPEPGLRRRMTPDEASEYAEGIMRFFRRAFTPVTVIFLLLSPWMGYWPLGFLAALWTFGVVVYLWWRFCPPRLRVELNPDLEDERADWAELLPNGAPWTIDGKPASWRHE